MTLETDAFSQLLARALERRTPLMDQLHAESTDCYRLFHGIAEGMPGLTLDRYGRLLLLQTFRDALLPEQVISIEAIVRERLPYPICFAYNHRGKAPNQSFDEWHRPAPEALVEHRCQEGGVHFLICARHPGIDPWLFLDLRAGRRFLRDKAAGLSVLNLFAYTCSAGLSAFMGGAREVWNVDFAASNLEVGRRNASLNGVPDDRFRTVQADCLPVLRQLAGLPPGGRKGRNLKFTKVEPREFDIVFLDPPAWAKSAFGAVDVAGDYPTLFKPAVLAARARGGRVIATNHVASIEVEAWINVLERCASKAGRPIRSIEIIAPDDDFPSFDGRPPLKIAVCEV